MNITFNPSTPLTSLRLIQDLPTGWSCTFTPRTLAFPGKLNKRDREASTSAEIVLHTEDVTDIEDRLFRSSY
ncbi:hypothetical protein ASPFODRAFT_41454 [Aspergillus luchuensis CBS 106.47]|uniref:Uncharacterized protein n=1 Tax=Aspergillus luchuensis (strain CBS 106.47) TaxID=1137211 RepID=A0A1M3TWC7_ASPLC|nr:hypothetical protein ASPFODRAFT_41454 [Aspergillus luchuensis CBS 106.47]